MTIGDKIRFYRTLRGYTQADLGKMVSLPGDRIRQYENDVRTPKADMLEALADALDVDVAALSDINITSEEDILHILFELEDNFSIDIEKQDGKTVLVIDNEDKRNSVLNTYLNYWYDKKQVFSLDKYSLAKDPNVIDYRKWRGRFGSNEAAFEAEVLQNIDDAYKAKVTKLSKAKTKQCETISDLVRLLCNISPDLLIGTDEEMNDILNPVRSYGFVFDAEQLIKPSNTSEAFARFLYEFDNFKKQGYKCYTAILYTGSILKIVYFITSNGFIMVTEMIDKWINYNQKKGSYSSLARKEFEKQFEDDLKFYSDAKIKEITELYGK
ncbi:MAG: helix-turn-helix domain-containing protein [Saccharofermentans sp.]|nr:helix-turn-helix domain-containing protein [Saccharofermentans sp.]